MKTTSWAAVIVATISIATVGLGQTTDPLPSGAVNTPSSIASVDKLGLTASSLVNGGDWQASLNDWGSTEWQRTVIGTNSQSGELELQTNHYTEIANNLNFINTSGEWERSVERIELMTNSGGAAALRGATKVYFPPTLGGGDGPITITTASNTVLKLQPIALYFFDAQSGKSVLLGSAQSAEGQVVAVNQVVYKSVFDGLSCDLRFTYTKGACESDLVMLARPKSPESYGLSNATTRLELWHSLDGPVPLQTPTVLESVTDPVLRASMADPDFIDETLDFLDLHFPQGRAFSWNGLDDESSPNVPAQVRLPNAGTNAGEVVVAKRYDQLGQTPALVESVRWTEIEPYLESLPLMAQGSGLSSPIQQASLERQLPVLTKQTKTADKPMLVARNGYKAKGFVLDYITLSGGYTTYTFSSGTYFISGFVSVSSTCTFSAGCCLKYTVNASLYLTGPISCSGTTANPSVLTSMHDNAFGSIIAGSTGYPSYSADEAIWLNYTTAPQLLNGFTIRWAQTGIEVDGNAGTTYTLTNSSIEWCQTGVYVSGCTIVLQNSTMCTLTTPVNGSHTGSLTDICNGNDSNGLPLSWEYAYFGQSGINANGDPDGDGLSNQQEYSCGTNPQVSDRPTIQPQNPLVAQGGSVTFTTTPSGTAPASYQWAFNGVNIPGATTSTYVVNNVQLANSGNYSVSSVYSCASVSSTTAFLSVATPTSGTPAPQGIVDWWPGNGNANDVVGTNNGTLFNGAGYAAGEVGQAFSFSGGSDYVGAPDAPSLNQTNAVTVECWVYINAFPSGAALIAGKDGTSVHEYQLALGNGPGHWCFYPLVNLGGTLTYFNGTVIPQLNTWYHVAMTYDKVTLRLFVNGVQDGSLSASGAIVPTSDSFLIGGYGTGPWTLNGRVDEVSLYNRALSQSEIQSIYNAGAAGKYTPPAPPTITSQPQSLCVAAGANASFSVSATGTTPYSYQWTFNGVAISSATTSSYTVQNVQSGNVGNYTVVVANSGGSVLSGTATLSLLGSCCTPPLDVLDWWRAEGNGFDSVGTNMGQLMGSAAYGLGEVGQSFSFNGTSGTYVQIPSNSSLQLSNQFTLELWFNDTGSVGWYGLIAKRSSTSPYPCNFGINVNKSGNYMQIYFLDPTTSPSYQVSTLSPLPQVNTFHHLAATFQQAGSQVQIQTYIDGQCKQTNSFNGNLSGTFDNSPVTIGASYPNGEFFVGLIDEASIYSRALTPNEIQTICNAGSSGKCWNIPGDFGLSVTITHPDPNSNVP